MKRETVDQKYIVANPVSGIEYGVEKEGIEWVVVSDFIRDLSGTDTTICILDTVYARECIAHAGY